MHLYGRLESFWETGTEGIHWSLNDSRLPGYDALWSLMDGDHLRVIDDSGQAAWEGDIKLEYERRRHPEGQQQHIRGHWVHGFQDDLDPEVWANMFFNKLRAVLHPVPRRYAVEPWPHPFLGPSSSIARRLAALSVKAQRELYRKALYPWLVFFSDGTPFSFAMDRWDFTLDETLRLIGSPTEEQIAAGKEYPKASEATLMPFTFERLIRLALLFGVLGGLDWKFATKEQTIAWLNDGVPTPKDLLLLDITGIIKVRDMVEIPPDA